ncbi:hypothetical protein [Gynuella sunshinyii]|uniref:Uncharacterized protein n=1 Tax=Gynuella sunshinyii YC6258 TaxID=1445510 RepID=A0A0C5VU78_9GAMM|nr:hypothetical protein [Gynuella sunshinyii]AJQ93959.1 hypothetical Protein YC6258_01915 [Gynuella sunshinyii YC6258]
MITEQQLDDVVAYVAGAGLSEATIATLKQTYPDWHYTYAFDDDMGHARPVRERDDFNVYLVNASDHCAQLTTQPEHASGVVFAEIGEEW